MTLANRIMEFHFRRPWVLPLAIGLFLAIIGQGSRGLYESTEGRYAECARELWASGSWLQPMLNGEPHLTKPPLTYWAIGAGTALLGNTVWGARLYLVVVFVLTVLALYVLERALWERNTWHFGALIFAAAPFPIACANVVAIDAMLTLWTTCALACYWVAIRNGRSAPMIAMWAFLGLAVASKGPVGLIPLLSILPVHLFMRRRNAGTNHLLAPWGLLIFALIGCSWYVYMILHNSGLVGTWVREEILGRTLYSAHIRLSSKPIKILENYVPIFLLGLGPWLPLWAYHARHALQWKHIRTTLDHPEKGPQLLFLLLAVLAPFVVFSLTTSRLPLYLAPIFPPMAAGIGKGLETLCAQNILRRVTFMRILLVLTAVLAVLKVASGYQESWKNSTALARDLRDAGLTKDCSRLVVFFREPINGLSYHLGHRLLTVYVTQESLAGISLAEVQARGELPPLAVVANGDTLLQANTQGAPARELPTGTCLIMRGKDAQLLKTVLPKLRFRCILETKSWSVIEVQQPLKLSRSGQETTMRIEIE